jgi:predicted sugar kinase
VCGSKSSHSLVDFAELWGQKRVEGVEKYADDIGAFIVDGGAYTLSIHRLLS